MDEKQKRKMISIRFDQETLDMLATVQGLKGTLYSGKTRTWLLEYAAKRVYGDLASNGSK